MKIHTLFFLYNSRSFPPKRQVSIAFGKNGNITSAEGFWYNIIAMEKNEVKWLQTRFRVDHFVGYTKYIWKAGNNFSMCFIGMEKIVLT